MNDWHNFFNRVDNNLATSNYRIFDEQAKTEIFEWFRREDVAKEQKEDFIQALVNFTDDCGDFYRYRAYFLAAEAINYFKDCSLGDAIASQILKWSHNFFRQDKQDWQIVPQPLAEAARATLEKTDKARVVSAFVHLVHTTQSLNVRRLAAEKLGKLDPGNKSAIAALVLLLQVTQDNPTIWNITHSLMQIDEDNPAVIPSLVKLIQTNTNEGSDIYTRCHILRYAADALGKVDLGNQTAINILIGLIPTITERIFIYCLNKIAVGNEAAIDALISLIQTTEDKDICLTAVVCLGEIALGSQSAIAALTEFLQINQGDRNCFFAAKALWQIDEGNLNAISALVQIIANTADRYSLKQATNYLLEIDPINVSAISALTERMNTADEYVRCDTAADVLKFEPNNIPAISILLEAIYNKEDLNCCLRAVDSLLDRDLNNQLAIDAVFKLVQYLGQSPFSPDYLRSIYYDVYLSLTKIDSSNQQAIAALANLFSTTENDFYLLIAVGSLEHFTLGDREAIAALTKLIDSTEDNYLLSDMAHRLLLDVAHKLGRIDSGNQKALFKLIEFIQTMDESDNKEICSTEYEQHHRNLQRLEAANKLQEILLINQMPQVVVALKDYLNKSNWDSSYRYEACYRLIWHCAQNMTYPDFYEAWHKSP
jgi:HEAT repeat protein